jgi:hypothetical protein
MDWINLARDIEQWKTLMNRVVYVDVGRTKAQAVSRWLPTAAGQVQTRV